MENVILLHGLGRSHRSMRVMERVLISTGYHVFNVNYPSTQYSIETLAETTLREAVKRCNTEHKIHFVSHSMGGILLRQYLKYRDIERLGRVVMLGPPNQGSQVVDIIGRFWLFRFLNGPAGQQLDTSQDSLPNILGKVNFELGVIAGKRSVDPVLSLMLPRPNDGKVSVENTKISGMKDHITLPVTHTFMMNNKQVINQVQHFLQHGKFKHEKAGNV